MDYRNAFLNEVKLVLLENQDTDTIFSRISILLDRYELMERTTEIVTQTDTNIGLLKLYASALLVDGKAKSTIAQYVRELKVLSATNNDLKTLKTFDIRNYLAKRKLDGVSNRTLENIRAIITAFYGWLSAEDIIGKNPCASIKPIKFDDEIRLPFTTVEIDQLRSACKDNKQRAVVEFLLSTGVRVSEFCDLEISDIDFSNNSVRIRHGKGGKERYTYMTELAKVQLMAYLGDRKEGVLFMTRQGDRYQTASVRFLLRSLGKRAGVDDVHPHRFRRTFATTLASRGMQIQEIQKLLGHSNINTTMVYVSISNTDTQYAYKKFA